MADVFDLKLIGPGDEELVGGKGLQLGLLAQAGLPIPPAFCVTTSAHRRLNGGDPRNDPLLKNAVASAYEELGARMVAVRSSSTAEDGAVTSFAGQQDTFLGIEGALAILEAIGHCWASSASERAQAYRKHHQQVDKNNQMAVVVQELVAADVAGVLFTRDPLDPDGARMLVEASWGLGETVVSGQVAPDRFALDRETGRVLEQQIQVKTIQRTVEGLQPVPPPAQKRACLDESQLAQLHQLALSIESFYGEPRDVEWAWTRENEGRFWVLQARPVTTPDAAERERARRGEIARLRELAEPEGTVWSRYNLAEILPEPTPMTWAVVRRMMSGRGGLGLMYRDLGFRPHASLNDAGIYDLVCGRPYCNLSREPRFYSGWIPYEHPFEYLKANPHKALYPQARPNPSRRGALFWLFLPFRLPFHFFRSIRFALRLNAYNRSFGERFRHQLVPAFVADVEREQQEELGARSTPALLERLEHWTHRALYEFARDSLKPTALASIAMANVVRLLSRPLGAERSQQVVGELSMGIRPDPEADLAAAIRELQSGKQAREAFLAHFGHRGPREMELAQPRWSEMAELPMLAVATNGSSDASSLTSHSQTAARLADEAKLTGLHRTALEQQVAAMQSHLSLRETAKHYLMMGYALLRRFLVELGHRCGLGDDVFQLTPDELPRLLAEEDLGDLIRQRKRQRAILLGLELPQVLFSDELEVIGRPQPVKGGKEFQGVPLSLGSAEAPALVLREPTLESLPEEPYVLVCPSTDPAWVPLFGRAKGLVMETGGVLSHGAIVAREFGLPAVAGLPGILQRIETGRIVRVEGGSGKVWILDDAETITLA